MSFFKKTIFVIFLTILFYSFIMYFEKFLIAGISITPLLFYFFFKLRNCDLMSIPFHLLAKIQGKNFKVMTTFKDIKKALQLTDKGRALEELFSCEAWKPIISLESVNSPIWDEIKKNYLQLKQHFPKHEIISEIAREEAELLISKDNKIDSKQISISTVKIFLKWILYDDKSLYEQITDDLIDRLYKASLEFRKEIAIKGKGCLKTKEESVTLVMNLIKQSKYKDLFDWDKPICYSIIMQPFIISPMINMSDIGVNIKKYISEKEKHKDFAEFVEYCIFMDHPFPALERYDEITNTQIFINLTNLKNNKEFDGKLISFGMGTRSCLGRVFAKEFLNSFFPIVSDSKNFKPNVNHLYSGRDNDNEINLFEIFYLTKTVMGVILNELLA